MSLFRKGLLLLTLLLGLSLSAFGQSIRAEGASVVLNEITVLTFRSSLGGLSPSQRAQAAVSNLRNHLRQGSISVKKSGRRAHRVVVGDSTLVIVSKEEAASHGTSTASLASSWAANLRSAAALPALKLEDTYFKLPPDATRQIRLVGSKAYAATVNSSDDSVVVAKRTNSGVQVRTVGAGTANVLVTAGGSIQSIEVKVLPYAATFPQSLTANVTGLPATADTVAGALEGAIRTGFVGALDCEINFQPIASQVSIGESRVFTVPIKASAPGCFPKSGNVQVTVKNLALGKQVEEALWYCNDPESLKKPGNLFAADLKADTSVRLLYHHINESSQPLFVRVEAVNESDQPATLMLIPGDSRPDKNPVKAGWQAADQFVRNWVCGSGEVVTIPPKSAMPISLRRLAPQQTMSGLCTLRLLDTGASSVFVRADAIPPFELDGKWALAVDSSAPWREVGTPKITFYDTAPSTPSQHIYPNPYKEEEVNYEVGGRYGFVRIGQKPIARLDQNTKLDGNFGVFYTIKANVENPTESPTNIEVVFEASAGYSGALFVVNGQYKRIPLLQPKEESQVAAFRLEPGGSKNLTIQTIPLSGGSYPATITIRPVQTLLESLILRPGSA